MKLHRLAEWLWCAGILACLTISCKSTAPAVSGRQVESNSTSEYVESVMRNAPSFTSFSSKMKLTIHFGGKEISVNGSLKMKKDEAIQLSLSPFLGIEVARIEITPDNILVIDRMNKRYVKAPASTIKTLADTDLDFYALQALFGNELFLPGVKDITDRNISLFKIKKEPTGKVLLQYRQKELDYQFTSSLTNVRLTATTVSAPAGYQLEWKYADFKPFAGKHFPTRSDVTFTGGGNMTDMIMELSKISDADNGDFRTEVPAKYKQMDIHELIKQLLNL